jgi:hypothetical protein
VLAVGEWWKADGVWLRLAEVDFGGTSFALNLELWNKTSSELPVQWQTGCFVVIDNVGHKYDYHPAWNNYRENAIVPKDTRQYLLFTPPYRGSGTILFTGDNWFKQNVTSLELTVTDISRIEEAKWRIPINK